MSTIRTERRIICLGKILLEKVSLEEGDSSLVTQILKAKKSKKVKMIKTSSFVELKII